MPVIRAGLLVLLLLLVGCKAQTTTNPQKVSTPKQSETPVSQSPPQDSQPTKDTNTPSEQLDGYRVKRTEVIPFTDGTSHTAWFVEGNDIPNLLGVFIGVGGKPVLMRPPSPSEGTLGPYAGEKLSAMDLNGDQTDELVLEGLCGAHTSCVWVYRFSEGKFIFSGDLWGDAGIRIDRQDRVSFLVSNRDPSDPAKKVQVKWEWRPDGFHKL